ncbi:hypothetical protein [Bosea sp. MMO-172]|uniref:hypothetical protein n=1 Tax=Bosea sp. MMO-172 TaxID=3127885 RepID=UPI00301AE865
MKIEISAGDDVLTRYAERLDRAGTKAPVAMARALNHESDKGRAQITGIKSSIIGIGFET